jgi:hypothetical protein
MWSVDGFHIVDLMTSHETLNSQYSVDNVLTHLLSMNFPQGRQRHALRLDCHLDNYHVHFPKASEQFCTETEIIHVPHPPYVPDLTPSDFWPYEISSGRTDG